MTGWPMVSVSLQGRPDLMVIGRTAEHVSRASSVLQCVAVCYSVTWLSLVRHEWLRCVAVCCSVLQCVVVCVAVWHEFHWWDMPHLWMLEMCCSVLQCVAVCCSVRFCMAWVSLARHVAPMNEWDASLWMCHVLFICVESWKHVHV